MSNLNTEQRIEILSLAARTCGSTAHAVEAAQKFEQFVTGNVPPTAPPSQLLATDTACAYAVEPEVIFEIVPVVRYVSRRIDVSANSVPAPFKDSQEYDDHRTAYAVGYALAQREQELRGYEPWDDRVVFPRATDAEIASND